MQFVLESIKNTNSSKKHSIDYKIEGILWNCQRARRSRILEIRSRIENE